MEKDGGLQFGIAIPQMFPTGDVDLSEVSGFLAKAESLGYHSGWLQERLLGSMTALDPIPFLAYAAAFTTRLRLGTSVMVTAFRNPIFLAKSLATIDQLSRGRLIVGLGIGGSTDAYPAFGMSARGRARRFEEGIQLMKRLWTEDRVTVDSRFWQMEDLSINVKPFRQPHPPIWFGAHSERALRRAVRLGDGWMGAGSTSTATFKQEIRLLKQLLEEEGRDPSTFALSKRVYVAVDGDKKGASEKLQEWFGQYYRNPALALEVSVIGNEEECLEGLGEIVSEGVDLLMLNPVYHMEEQAERLAQDVLPKLRR